MSRPARSSPIPTPGLDHVLFTSAINCSYEIHPPPINRHGVHHMLVAEWTIHTESTDHIRDDSLRRFNIRRLETPLTARKFYQYASHSLPLLRLHLNTLMARIACQPSDHIQELIDDYEETLVNVIREAAEVTLGSYKVSCKLKNGQTQNMRTQQQTVSAVETIRRFKELHTTNGRASTIHSRSHNKTVMEEVEDYYRSLFHQPEPKFRADRLPSAIGDATLANTYFSEYLVYKRIHRYGKAKSCGHDGLHCIILTHLCTKETDPWTSLFAETFQLFALVGRTPTRWNTLIIFPIPKSENLKHIDEFRPIALTAMMRRWFEMGILDYINKNNATTELRQFNPAQAGFRSGHSTLAPAVTAHERAFRDPKLYSIFLDFEGAYDLTVILLLLDKMKKKGASDGLTSIIASLFLFGTSVVVVNGKLTQPIPRQRGLAQGSLLSPTLYNIFLDDLLETLEDIARSRDLPPPLDTSTPYQLDEDPTTRHHRYERDEPLTPPLRSQQAYRASVARGSPEPARPPLLHPHLSDHHAYADDVILQQRETPRLQRMLDVCSLWSLRNGARFKPKKCGVVRPASSSHNFSIGIPRLRDDGQYDIDIQTIPVVEMYRYLGFPFHQRGIGWQEHANNSVSRAEALFHWCQRLGGDWSEYSRLTVFKIFIRPILEYGGALLSYISRFGQLDLSGMEGLDEHIQRWIFSVARASISLRAVADIPSPSDRFFALSATFQLHVREYPQDSPIRRMEAHLRSLFLEYSTGSVLRHLGRPITTGNGTYQLPLLERRDEETSGELLNRRLREYHQLRYTTGRENNTMARCVLSIARNAGPRNIGADHVMRWPNPSTRRIAILWRINLFNGHHVVCPHCNERFHRGHLTSCRDYYAPLLRDGIPLLRAHREIHENIPASYNEIDALLNARAFPELDRLFTHFDIHLCQLSLVPQAAREFHIRHFGQDAPPLLGPSLRPDGADAF